MIRTRRAMNATAVAFAALAVATVLLAVVALSALGGSRGPAGPAAPAPSQSERPTDASTAATAVTIFGADETVAADTTRDVKVDVAGAWPLGSCQPLGSDRGRVDFVSGTERGPEYTRDLAMGWYVDEASAVIAYDDVLARVGACAGSTGAAIESAASDLGTAGVLTTVAQPSADGVSDVSIYAITRIGPVVTLAVDHATFYDGTVPTPAEATITRGHAERLLAELCLVEPARC